MPERSYCIVSPSHMREELIVKHKAQHLFLNDPNIHIHSKHGLCNWSEDIMRIFEEGNAKGQELVWVVSDWSLNNIDITALKALKNGDLHLPGFRGSPGDVTRKYLNHEDIGFLASHTMKILDKVIEQYPKIKLIFWCIYQNTKNKVSSRIPLEHCGYDTMISKYPQNAVNIDKYLNKEGLKFSNVVCDAGGHPNLNGYEIIKKIINT